MSKLFQNDYSLEAFPFCDLFVFQEHNIFSGRLGYLKHALKQRCFAVLNLKSTKQFNLDFTVKAQKKLGIFRVFEQNVLKSFMDTQNLFY